MPVNIPYDQPVSQDLYAGTSEQQLDALTDLLMHFDSFAKRNLSLEAFLRQPAPGQRPAAPQSGAAPASPVPPAAAAPSPAAPSVRAGASAGRSPGAPSALN
jgi:hypothetical protein